MIDMNGTNGTNDNDNEPLSFQSLGLAAAIVVNRIRNAQALRELDSEEKREDVERKGEYPAGGPEQPGSEEHRAYVERRIRDIATFERRVSGNKN